MRIGTKSLLFGVHQFIWHPITVIRAWRWLYSVEPTFDQKICIWLHDIGYWGCDDLDGQCGKSHPVRGALLAEKLVYWRWKYWKRKPEQISRFRAYNCFFLTAMHSSSYAKLCGEHTSALFLPDKASILCEPRWCYMLRARLTGEWREFVENSPKKGRPFSVWYSWYVSRVLQKVHEFFFIYQS